MTEHQDTSPIKVPDALMSAMGFTVAELNPGRTIVTLDSEFSEFPEFVDPVFQAKVAEYVARDDASFASWLAESDMDAHVDFALQAGRAAFAASAGMPEEENPRWTLAVIDLGHRRAKPLVQALARRDIGEHEIWNSYTWDVGFAAILGRRSAAAKSANSAQRHAVVDAFAMALSKPGFELQIWRE